MTADFSRSYLLYSADAMCTSFFNRVVNNRTNKLYSLKAQPGTRPFHGSFKKLGHFSYLFASGNRKLSSEAKDVSFTVSYLVNSWGLSLETANYVSKRVHFDTPEKADYVLALLRRYGFTDAQVSKLIRAIPRLLSNSPKTLLPKFEFFSSKATPGLDLPKIISSNPLLLSCSLEDNIIPRYDIFKHVLVDDHKVMVALTRSHWGFYGNSQNVLPNVMLLKKHQVPQSSISFLVLNFPGTAFCEPSKFEEIVKQAERMEFEPRKRTFVLGIHVLNDMKSSNFESKFEVYGRWGLSRGDILSAFRKNPHCMLLSENRIMEKMDFFVNTMGCSSESIARCPNLMILSLEKRIVPRWRVIRTIRSKGLIIRFSLSTLLIRDDHWFRQMVITKYQESVPQLLDLYQGKTDLQDAGIW